MKMENKMCPWSKRYKNEFSVSLLARKMVTNLQENFIFLRMRTDILLIKAPKKHESQLDCKILLFPVFLVTVVSLSLLLGWLPYGPLFPFLGFGAILSLLPRRQLTPPLPKKSSSNRRRTLSTCS
jgi:hypothetical protein